MTASDNPFSSTYTEARNKFLAAARAAGADLFAYEHTSQKGPDGESLFLDVARLGPADAAHVLVVGSGTHGIEGFTGSAAQTYWLQQTPRASLPADTAVVLFHAHNPWGFAHQLRFTEHNVDLNRNFIDFSKGLPANPEYPLVHALIAFPEWREEAVVQAFERLNAMRESIGEQRYSDAFNGGQYSHQDGIFYGGSGIEWSNQAFRQAVEDHVAKAKSAAIIDLHTGIGPERGHVFLCFHPQGTPAYERARHWWGERAVNREGVNHKAVAKYSGLLVDAFVAMLPDTQTTAVVVEFGTRPRPVMQRASMAARYVFSHDELPAEQRTQLMHDIREAFYPSEPDWRASVLAQSLDIINPAVRGVAGAA